MKKAVADYPEAPNLPEARKKLKDWLARKDDLAIGQAVLKAETLTDPDAALQFLRKAIKQTPNASNLSLAEETLTKLESSALSKALQPAREWRRHGRG